MNPEILLAFLLGMIVLAATPGPGVFASVAKAISESLKSSLFLIAGLIIGDIIFFLLALIGMSAISRLMGQLFFIIKIAGGIYLIYLGINIIKQKKLEFKSNNLNSSKYKSLVSGLLVTLGNPKPILFYASVVPTLININEINIYEVLAIILIIAVVSFLVLGTYCYLAILSKSILVQQKYQSRVNIMSGLVMIAAGSYVIFKKG